MKVIVDKDIPYIKGRLEAAGIETVYTGQNDFTPALIHDADALLIRTRTRCDRRLLENSSVRLIATATIGMDQIDTAWCEARGIKVRNAPGCNAPGVAQYVWSTLLRLWKISDDREGYDKLKHKTLGIVGCGNVGSIVKEWGEKLGVNIIVSDPPKGFDYPLTRLMAESDAVTLHTPLTLNGLYPTHHLIGAKELAAMRDGAILINAARGPVVDFNALRPEVLSHRILTAVDTWEGEPVIDEEILKNVDYGTFHIAGYSLEGKQRATRMVLEAVEDIFDVRLDKSGLAPDYMGIDNLTVGRILNSFDPAPITSQLRQSPGEFDILRNNYILRNET